MKFFNLSGKVRNVKIEDYIVDWNRVVSKPQKAAKDFLYKFWKTDIVLEEFRIPNTLLRIDLFNVSKKIVVEISPAQHTTLSHYFNQNSPAKFLASLKRDMKKEEFCKFNNIKFVEIFDEDWPLTKSFFKQKYEIEL